MCLINEAERRMSKGAVPKSLTEEQIKFWLANTSLNREQLLNWYANFQDFASKNKRLDKENFFKFFEQLHHAKRDSESFYQLAFNGDLFYLFICLIIKLKPFYF